jgi:hypothetical protein
MNCLMDRPIQTKALDCQDHRDGHGLADRLTVYADDRDPAAGNASHVYLAFLDDAQVLAVQFQHGPRNEPGSTPGAIDAVLLTVLLDRYRGFQAGPFSCRDNAIVITHLEDALLRMKKRADDRAHRGVLGKNLK